VSSVALRDAVVVDDPLAQVLAFRSYKRDLDRNRLALRELKRRLASRGYPLTEVRILDVLIWSAFAA
jgi:hypothetical protein